MTIDAHPAMAFDRAEPRFREKPQDRITFDLQSARTIDPLSGHMHVRQTNISKATVNEYRGSEIPGWKGLGLDPEKIYALLRDPEELKAAAKSFDGKPLVMVHREQAVDDADHINRVGSIYNTTFEHPYLKADLSVLDQVAIDAIESKDQRELSCGYGYEPDMTPGEYEGVKFDGVMRGIGGNHCCLVREGRAGHDCYVFDSLENIRGMEMTKTPLSRKAILAQGALEAYLAPKMAKDQKVDLTPMVKDVTAQNFKAKVKTIAADVLRQTKGKLAKDENLELEQVAAIIEAVAAVDPVEPEIVDPVVEPVTEDDDDADLVSKLVAKGYSEEEAKKIAARTPAPAAADDKDDDKDEKEKSAKDKQAMDELRKALTAANSKIAAMDAKIEKARSDGASDAIRTQREIFSAINFVKPWVGESHAFDSANSEADVLRIALIAMDEKDVEDLPEKAMRRMIEKMPKPGERQRSSARIAQDGASVDGFFKRYPEASHIRTL